MTKVKGSAKNRRRYGKILAYEQRDDHQRRLRITIVLCFWLSLFALAILLIIGGLM